MGWRIDEILACPHYHGRMRRLWLTLLLAFSLAASGFAGAAMASDCPMQAAAQHDCYPDGGSPDDPIQTDLDGCMAGMACRSAPAVTPSLALIRLSARPMRVVEPVVGEPAPPSGPLQDLFRPPRSI